VKRSALALSAVAASLLAGCGGAAPAGRPHASTPTPQPAVAAADSACANARAGRMAPPPATVRDVPAYAQRQAATAQRTLAALAALPAPVLDRSGAQPVVAAYERVLGAYAQAHDAGALAAAEQQVAAAALRAGLRACTPLPIT
jgi:hypothetical protein